MRDFFLRAFLSDSQKGPRLTKPKPLAYGEEKTLKRREFTNTSMKKMNLANLLWAGHPLIDITESHIVFIFIQLKIKQKWIIDNIPLYPCIPVSWHGKSKWRVWGRPGWRRCRRACCNQHSSTSFSLQNFHSEKKTRFTQHQGKMVFIIWILLTFLGFEPWTLSFSALRTTCLPSNFRRKLFLTKY